MEAELLDWEIVNGSDTESADSITSEKHSGSSSVIDDGMILSHHFSPSDLSLESGDSSRVDQLGVYESGDGCVRNELGLSDGGVKVSDFEAAHEKQEDDGSHVEDCLSETEHLQVSDVEEHVEDLSNSCSDSGGNQLVSGIVNGEDDIVSDNEAVQDSEENTVHVVDEDSVVRCGDESKTEKKVWWKMPLVLVKYSAFRIGPVWSVSMAAAALLGFVLLGRRLYNIKNKPQKFHLKVAIDYKKVSRVMNQAARLNEAFTEVRRVPVIRPALPAPGTWPVLSLR